MNANNPNTNQQVSQQQPIQQNNKKMKTCKACGAPIAKKAKKCPQCGAKNKKPIYKRFWFILLIIIVIAIIVSVVKGSKNYDFSNPEQTVTVDTILQDYQDNITTANEKYSDKVVAVTGKVYKVNDGYVSLEAYDDDLWLYYVNAYMTNAEDLKQFTNGTTTTIVGVCDDVGIFGDVTINQCSISNEFAIEPDYDNPIDVDAATIVKAYQDNQVSADSSYKYKTIKLTGKITYLADDYAVLEPNGTDAWDWDSDVQIYFENDSELANVKKDETVTIIGECYGKADVYTIKICRAIVD